MEISYLKKTQKDVVVKAFGYPGAVTINLNDLVIDNETSASPIVNLIGVSWAGSNDAEITISRNNQVLLTLASTGSNYINFSGDSFTPDINNNAHNFSINMVGTQAQVWLRLRKLDGYYTYLYTNLKQLQNTVEYNETYILNTDKYLGETFNFNCRCIYDFNSYIGSSYCETVYVGNPTELSNIE